VRRRALPSRISLAVLWLVALTGVVRAEDGVDFIADAKLLYRIAACGGGGGVVDAQLEKIVAKHCKVIDERLDKFRAEYFGTHREWFASVVPADAPSTVVYPFGGGDLVSALVAFPDATEITTISLELAGDPRRLRDLEPMQLQLALGGLRAEIGGLLAVGSNTTANMTQGQQNELPTQISSFLLGLVAGGYEPVAMRFFTLDDAGNIDYVDQAEIDAADKIAAKKQQQKKKKKKAIAVTDEPSRLDRRPSFSPIFGNVEIRYRKAGETAVRVHRHIGWNLGDGYLKTHPQLIRHLEKKGHVTMLVKGGSYLLWSPGFSRIRGYILDHLAWMLSDSTGVPPHYAKPAGMVQETYGVFSGAFLESWQGTKHEEDFIELWKSQQKRRMPFRFGYVDMNKQAHVVVTKPRAR